MIVKDGVLVKMAEESFASLFSQKGHSEGEKEQYEAVTTAEVLRRLEEAWLNEKFSPELLEPKTEIVDIIKQQIKEVEEKISQLPKGTIVATAHYQELDRIRFVFNSYLRTRLAKIEKYTMHVLAEESSRAADTEPKLTPEELTFAKEYASSVQSHMESLALQFMPQNFQRLDHKQMASKPNMEHFVFCEAKERIADVVITPEDLADQSSINFEKGSQHLVQYKLIASLLKSNKVKLI